VRLQKSPAIAPGFFFDLMELLPATRIYISRQERAAFAPGDLGSVIRHRSGS